MKNFYLNNYKILHHLFGLALFVVIFHLMGHFEIYTNVFFQALILTVNYFLIKFILKYSGIDYEVEKELNKTKKESQK